MADEHRQGGALAFREISQTLESGLVRLHDLPEAHSDRQREAHAHALRDRLRCEGAASAAQLSAATGLPVGRVGVLLRRGVVAGDLLAWHDARHPNGRLFYALAPRRDGGRP